MKGQSAVEPLRGNINLMISIEEIEHIINNSEGVEERIGYLVKLDEHSYRLPAPGETELDRKLCLLKPEGLKILLDAPKGLRQATKNSSLDSKSKFRIELTKKDYWEIA